MIKKITDILKRRGLIGVFKLAAFRSINKLAAIPLFVAILLLSPLLRIRLIKLFSSRIGHYSFNTEAILCALDLKLEKVSYFKTVFYTLPNEPICNEQLHRMWKREIFIFPLATLAFEVDKLLIRFGGQKYKNDKVKIIFEPSGDGRDRWNLLDKVKTCHLKFTAHEELNGKQLLKELGIPAGNPYVCLLVRDSQYLNTYMPANDWSYHSYRDADINTYQMAAEYLAEKGYYVIRMGKHVKDPFQLNNSKIIDYANSPMRSDFMDIYLSANCFFFLSTCAGLDSVARVFRKPLLVTNLGLPDFDIWHPWDLFIPKKMLNVKDNRLLTFDEMNQISKKMSYKRIIMQTLAENHLRIVDNSAQEIKDVVEEMIAKLTNTWNFSENNEKLQQLFWSKFPKYISNNVLPELNAPLCDTIKMRVGSAFLQNNLSLLADRETLEVDVT